jgi:hypothetical protein
MSSSLSPDPGRTVADEDLGDLFEEAPWPMSTKT